MIVLRLNWASILFYSSLISYGYFAAMTSSIDEVITYPLFFIIKNVVIASLLFIFGYCSVNYKAYFEDSFTLSYKDFLPALFTGIILIFLGNDLNTSLIADEIAYSKISFAYSEYIVNSLISTTAVFDDYKYANLIQTCSAFILVGFISMIFLLNKLAFKQRIIMFILFLLIMRAVVLLVHGNPFPHPPLNLLPTFLMGTIFGIEDIVLKLSFFAGYLIFILIINKMILRKYNYWSSLLITLCIGTIPLFVNHSAMIDHSLWGAIAITLVLAELLTAKTVNYLRMISFISIFTMMRIPVFIAIVPLFLHYIFFNIKNKTSLFNRDKYLVEVFILVLPTAIFLPFLIHSIFVGTPAIEPKYLDTENFLSVIKSGVIVSSVVSSVSWPWILLAIFSFFLLEIKKSIIYFITLCLLIFMFFSIDASLWGWSKYQMEWLIPFSVIGLLALVSFLEKIKTPLTLIMFLIACLTVFNFYQYKSMSHKKITTDYFTENYKNLHHLKVYNPGYDYEAAFEFIKDNDLQGSTYSVGLNYGVFTELLKDYSVHNYRIITKLYEDVDKSNNVKGISWTSADPDIIDLNTSINSLMIGYMIPNKNEFINNMLNKGWKDEKEFYSKKYKSTIFLLRR